MFWIISMKNGIRLFAMENNENNWISVSWTGLNGNLIANLNEIQLVLIKIKLIWNFCFMRITSREVDCNGAFLKLTVN